MKTQKCNKTYQSANVQPMHGWWIQHYI